MKAVKADKSKKSDIPNLNLNNDKENVSKKINYVSEPISTNRTTFRRKGTTYVIKNTDDDHDPEVDNIYHVIDDFYDDIVGQSKMADFQANFYRVINVLVSIYITIAGAVTGILGINTNTMNNFSNNTLVKQDSGTLLAITVLGFSITVMKTLLVLSSIEKRSILLKESGIKLRKLSREIKNLKHENLTNAELFQRMDEIHTEIDELDIRMFRSEDKPEPQAPVHSTDTVVNL